MQNITLTVFDRLLLVSRVLPSEGGSFREAIRIRQLRNVLALTDDERAACDYVEENGTSKWDVEKAERLTCSFDFDEKDMEVIALGFRLFEQNGRVPSSDAFLDLYDKFADVIESVDA